MRVPLVNPVRLLFGPIFQMEVRTAGRRRSTYVFRSFLAALVLAFFGIILTGSWTTLQYQGNSFARLQAGQNIAPTLASYIIWTQYIALVLLAPVITGPALCDERRNRTMAALLTTPLTAWEIVLGKLTGRLTQAMILALISMPMIFAARVLGGLSVEGILAAVALTVISVVLSSSLALLVSAGSPRATTAASTAFLLFLLFNFGPLLLALMYNEWVQPNFPSLPSIPWNWVFHTSLPVALGMVVLSHFSGQSIGMSTMDLWGYAAIYGSALSIIVIILAGLSLRAAMRKDPEELMSRPARKKKTPKNKRRSKAGTPVEESTLEKGTHDESEDVQMESRIVGDHPVMWRELRLGIFRRRRRLIEASLVVTVIFGLLYYNDGLNEPASHMLVAMIGCAILLIQAIFGSTGAIAHERESRTLDVLMTTPLPPRAIIWGKFLGSLRRFWFVPAVVGAHLVISILAGVFHPMVLPLAALIVVPAVILFDCTGLLLSVLFQKGTSAAVANLFLALLVYLGMPMVMLIIENTFNLWDDSTYETVLRGVVAINPFAMSGVMIMGTGIVFGYSYGPAAYGSLAFDMPGGTMGLFSYTTMLSVCAFIQIGLAALVMAAASASLPERFGRSS